MLYHGSVQFVDNDADLALVGVEEPAFMNGITPMEIGETPHVQDDVLAVGYPLGGEDISYTRGIVSRIEDIRYSHGWTHLLGIQVDAAINSGNSGGPVLDLKSGKIAGIAFQGLGKEEGESLGYIIPPEIIRHFQAAGESSHFLESIWKWLIREAQGEDSRQVREAARHPKEVEGRGRDREARCGGEAVG